MKKLLAVLALLTVFLPTGTTFGQPIPCGLTLTVVDHLSKKFGESLVFRGINSRGFLVSIFINTETSTWTTIKTNPNYPEKSCMVESGSGARIMDTKIPGTDS